MFNEPDYRQVSSIIIVTYESKINFGPRVSLLRLEYRVKVIIAVISII